VIDFVGRLAVQRQVRSITVEPSCESLELPLKLL
jgi:hypothetical protein